ncbi:DUF1232 domain-containing protein [Thalassospira sp. HF15]|nr:YkvA family protein [Thalassospira sp. HF15]NIY77449.1 DUF1232 domain-containing protein [Thalassospira sp. HF15]
MIIPNLLRTLLRKDVALKSKLLLLAGLVYLISPVDLLPDLIVGLGWLDDLVIVPLLGWLSYRSLPVEVQGDVVPNNPESANTSRRLFVYLSILAVAVILIALMGGGNAAFEPAHGPVLD